MGIPKKSLYVIDIGDKEYLLLSSYKLLKREDGKWCYTKDIPMGLDMWIPKTSFPDYTPGDYIEVKVDISQEETSLYVANDPTEDCGGVRIYNITLNQFLLREKNTNILPKKNRKNLIVGIFMSVVIMKRRFQIIHI